MELKITLRIKRMCEQCNNEINQSVVVKPWGRYIVLHQGLNYLTKQIVVHPHQQLSLQYHNYRSEYWTIQTGIASVEMNGKSLTLTQGDSLFIPVRCTHRVSNNTDDILEIVEVQLGWNNEDDIVRLEDDYSRMTI